jgi:hypothetical protein
MIFSVGKLIGRFRIPAVDLYRHGAERLLSDLKERLAAYALSLHPEKTRLANSSLTHEDRLRRDHRYGGQTPA